MSFVGRNNGKITNRPCGGGNKLQGITSTTNKCSSSIRAIKEKAWGENRNLVFCINQLGGVGRYKTQFNSNSDGLNCKEGIINPTNNKILDSLKEIQLFIKKLSYYLKITQSAHFLYKLCLIGIHESFHNDIEKCHHVNSSIKDMKTPLLPYSDLADIIYSVYAPSSGKFPNFNQLSKILKKSPKFYPFPKISEGAILLDSVSYINHNIPPWINQIKPSLGNHKLTIIYNGIIDKGQTAHDVLYQCGYGVRVPGLDNIWAYTSNNDLYWPEPHITPLPDSRDVADSRSDVEIAYLVLAGAAHNAAS